MAVDIVPLVVLGLIALSLRWLIQKARVTAEDVFDESRGASAGAHLPSINPDLRDVVPRSLEMDIENERFRNSGSNAAGG